MTNSIFVYLLSTLVSFVVLFVNTASANTIDQTKPLSKQGIYTIFDAKAYDYLDLSAELQVLANGFIWTEGPAWDQTKQQLLFVDIPNNRIHTYSSTDGLGTLTERSEEANGLLITESGDLIAMLSSTRAVGKWQLGSKHTGFDYLATHYQGKRLNSPNDLILHDNGDLFFTDPPYGLKGKMQDPAKELAFQGVFRLNKNGELSLIDKELTFPNGITLSPDQRTLYVAVSDEDAPAWYQYALNSDGEVISKSMLFSGETKQFQTGLPDGLKAHSSGVLFATGPGGVWLFSADGKLLAHIAMPGFTANLALGKNESTLYLTASSELRALKLKH